MYPTLTQLHDQELTQRITAFLHRHESLDAKSVEVEVRAGAATLRGGVDSDYERKLCEKYCSHVAGVVSVTNELRVIKEASCI